MVQIKCDYCGNALNRNPSQLRNNIRNYCNKRCYGKHKPTWYVSPTLGKRYIFSEERKIKQRENLKKAYVKLQEMGRIKPWSEQEEQLFKEKLYSLSKEELCSLFNRRWGSIDQHRLKLKMPPRSGKSNYIKYKPKFDNVSLYELAYFFGIYLSDGYITNRGYSIGVEMITEDICEIKQRLEKMFNCRLGMYNRKKRTGGFIDGRQITGKIPMSLITINSKKLIDYLVLNYDFQNYAKTFNAKIPNWILQSENRLVIINFLRGLYDGDGCTSISAHSNVQVGYITASEGLERELKYLLDKFNLKSITYKDKSSFRIDLKGKSRLNFVEWLLKVDGISRKTNQLDLVKIHLVQDKRTKKYRTRQIDSYYLFKKWKLSPLRLNGKIDQPNNNFELEGELK